MKKVLLVGASVLLSLLLIPGCKKDAASAKNESAEKKLTVYWWGNQTRNERTQKILSLYSESHPGVTFDPQFAEWADYWNKLATSAAGHQMPDVVQMDYKYLNQYAEKNLLVDLSQYKADGTLDLSNVNEGILKAGSVDGKIYAIVNGVNAPALLYNKTLMDSLGLKVKDNMTLNEFLDLSREVYKKSGYKTNVAYRVGENFIDYIVRGQGKQLFNGNKFGVETAKEFERFFSIYEQGITEGWHVLPAIFTERTIGSVEQDPLIYGSNKNEMSWCSFQYSNQLNAFNKAKPENMEIGITSWPADDPVKANYLKPSQFFSVTVDSKNPKEAASLINYITNSVDCNNVLLGERGIPASSVVASAISEKLDATQQKIIDYINNVVSPNCSAIAKPAPGNSSQIFNLVDSLEEQICFKKLTAAQAAEQLFKKGNEILSQ